MNNTILKSRYSRAILLLFLLVPFFQNCAGGTRLFGTLDLSPTTKTTTTTTSVASTNYFGMLFNNLAPRPATNTPATPWPTNAQFGAIRLWDSQTSWWDLQPNNSSSYNWTNFDLIVSEAASNGKDILYTFGRTPQWALPTNIAIKSISRASNIVTVTTSVPTPINYVEAFGTTQTTIFFSGITNSSFTSLNQNTAKTNIFTVGVNTNGSTISFQQSGPDASFSNSDGSSIGTVSAICSGSFAPSEGCAEAPMNIADWDNFVTAVATRAAGRIKYWEMWNEINLQYFYKGDKATMVLMTQHAREIIKAIDPDAKILSPVVTACENNDARCGRTWISDWLSLGGKALVDIVGFHNYPSTVLPPEQIVQQVTDEMTVLQQRGMSATPLWDTESSWGVDTALPQGGTALAFNNQIAFLARHLILQASLGVQRSFWYAYESDWGNLFTRVSADFPQGIVNPAGQAYEILAGIFAGATYKGPCVPANTTTTPSTVAQVWSCDVTLASGSAAKVVWYDTFYSASSTSGINNTDATVNYSVSPKFSHYQTLDGQTQSIVGSTVSLSEVPVVLLP